jgi:hypothetical protein
LIIKQFPIHAISRSKTGRFALRNGPFRNAKCTVSQRQMVGIGMV